MSTVHSTARSGGTEQVRENRAAHVRFFGVLVVIVLVSVGTALYVSVRSGSSGGHVLQGQTGTAAPR